MRTSPFEASTRFAPGDCCSLAPERNTSWSARGARRSRSATGSARGIGARSERRRGEAAGDAQTVATMNTRRSALWAGCRPTRPSDSTSVRIMKVFGLREPPVESAAQVHRYTLSAAPGGRDAAGITPPSSSGLGRRPFKAEARVRIPLGARHRASRHSTCARRGVRPSSPPCQGGDRGIEARRARYTPHWSAGPVRVGPGRAGARTDRARARARPRPRPARARARARPARPRPRPRPPPPPPRAAPRPPAARPRLVRSPR